MNEQNGGWPAQTTAEIPTAETETPEQLLERQKEAVAKWLPAKKSADDWKAYENNVRRETAAICFPSPTRGTNRLQLGDGNAIKLVYTLSYKLGKKDLVNQETGEPVSINEQIKWLESQIAALAPEGKILVERLIKWEPSLSETEYRKLSDLIPVEKAAKELIDRFLTVTPAATPSLTFEPAKDGQ